MHQTIAEYQSRYQHLANVSFFFNRTKRRTTARKASKGEMPQLSINRIHEFLIVSCLLAALISTITPLAPISPPLLPSSPQPLLRFASAQTNVFPSIPLTLNGAFSYASNPSLFPNVNYLDASATVVIPPTVPNATTTSTTPRPTTQQVETTTTATTNFTFETTPNTTITATVSSTNVTQTTEDGDGNATTMENSTPEAVVPTMTTKETDMENQTTHDVESSFPSHSLSTTASSLEASTKGEEEGEVSDTDSSNSLSLVSSSSVSSRSKTQVASTASAADDTKDQGGTYLNEYAFPNDKDNQTLLTDQVPSNATEGMTGGNGGEVNFAFGDELAPTMISTTTVISNEVQSPVTTVDQPPPSASSSTPARSTALATTQQPPPSSSLPPPQSQWVDYCTTPESATQLQSMCNAIFGVSPSVSGFGTSLVQWSWGVGNDGVSRGAALVNGQMFPQVGTTTAMGCETLLETSSINASFRYVSSIKFACVCNMNSNPQPANVVISNAADLLLGLDTAPASVPTMSSSDVSSLLFGAVPGGASIPMTIDTRQAAISKNPNAMSAQWATGFESSQRGGYCEPRTGRCPQIGAITQLFSVQHAPLIDDLRRYKQEQAQSGSSSTSSDAIVSVFSSKYSISTLRVFSGGPYGCAFLSQYPYIAPLQNYFQDCTPRTLKCTADNSTRNVPVDPLPSSLPPSAVSSADITSYNKTVYSFTCPLCRGGVQVFTMVMVSYYNRTAEVFMETTAAGGGGGGGSGIVSVRGVSHQFVNCTSNYFAPSGSAARSCSDTIYNDCNGNGCCRTEENSVAAGLSSGSGTCACFDNDLEGHYIGTSCERCNTRYTFCTDGACSGGAIGIPYFTCIVDQQQLFVLLADLSTSGMAMTMPLLLMLGVFIAVGIVRSSWESDQEFEITRIRRGGCNIVAGKLSSLPQVGISNETRQRLHLAIDRKIIPERPAQSTGMVMRKKRALMSAAAEEGSGTGAIRKK